MSEINPLNTELNPICHLLALLGAHHVLHVSRIGVKNIADSFVGVIYEVKKDIARTPSVSDVLSASKPCV